MLKLNIGSIEANIFGKSLVLVQESKPWFGALLHPQMKVFICLLWPWRSQNREMPADYFAVSAICIFMKYTSGCIIEFGLDHRRLRSTPDNDDLELPMTTPSGLSIGTSLIIQLDNIASYFWQLAVSSSRIFLIMNDPCVSAAWSRAWMYITDFFLCFTVECSLFLVKVS